MPNYLVVATSGRAIAQGLKSLGHSVYVVDGFADIDTCAAATLHKQVKRSHLGLDSRSVIQAVTELHTKITFDGLFYDAALESCPSLLNELDVSPVLGNSSQVLSACKDPQTFFPLLEKLSIPYPETSFKSSLKNVTEEDWLIKQAKSTGGFGVRYLNENENNNENSYAQKRLEGLSFSIAFIANGEHALVLGFNTLWNEALNEDILFAYAGAINTVKLQESVKQTALAHVELMAREFKLQGLNSIDFICTDECVYVLEINPRIPATYELYETKYGELLQEHIQACVNNELPEVTRAHILRAHAIVYAPYDITVPTNMLWPLWTADRPHAQEVIKKHEPVCSIFAGGQNSAQVYEMIKTRKQSIVAKLAE